MFALPAAVATPVPILEYHVVAAPPPDAPYPALYVRVPQFAAEVRWLARHHYSAVTMDQVEAAWTGRGSLPRRPVVFTFDDGYRSTYTHALPILRRRHWPGNLNLEVRRALIPSAMPPWRLRRLIGAGWEIDAHTINHLDLTAVTTTQLRHEVAGSRQWIRLHLHVPVDFFCYPAGRYDATVIAAVKAAGFVGAETENPGFATPEEPYELPRIRVNLDESLATFAASLRRRP
jgi:peptidoglycan/xylan/chitin deacetylase (PgdA/CDA1 family)